MAVLEKKFDKNKWAEMLKIEQEKKKAAKEAVDAHKAADLLIGSRKSNLNQPGETGPYKAWDKTNPEHPDYVDPSKIPGEIIQPTIPGLDIPLAHHINPNAGEGAGLDGFQDVPPQEILRRHMTGEQSLSPEDLERIFGPDYEKLIQQQQQKQSLKIGDPLVAMNPADIPLGDGLIYETKTQMQKNLKEKYDFMLQNGFIDEVEYQKQMERLFGTKNKKK